MKKILIFSIIILFAAPSYAVYKINPHTGKAEQTTKDSKLRLNTRDMSWHYADPKAHPRINPSTGNFDMAPSNHRLKINPHTGKSEYADPDAQLKYDPINKK